MRLLPSRSATPFSEAQNCSLLETIRQSVSTQECGNQPFHEDDTRIAEQCEKEKPPVGGNMPDELRKLTY